MSIPQVNAFYVGLLLALNERTVGLYGSLVKVNAYDRSGVEAGEKAEVLDPPASNDLRSSLAHGNEAMRNRFSLAQSA